MENLIKKKEGTMKVNSISANNSALSANKTNKKQAFGMKLEISETVKPLIDEFVTAKQAQFNLSMLFDHAAHKMPTNHKLVIYKADGQIVGELSNGGTKPIASKIGCGEKVQPDNYFKLPQIIEGIMETTKGILQHKGH